MSPVNPIERDETLRIGASWYPEMWPESQWPADVDRMRELGFNVVRMFEFAWHRFEPAEGQYDFDWARRVLDLCAQAGIAVMVGTPTAAPPAWLTDAHPEVLKIGNKGQAGHGMRCHYSAHSPVYREYCRKIVTAIVDALADHPAVHSWQIDNEMAGADRSQAAREAFPKWLQQRYGSVEEMNRRWGLEFWSQAYNRFEQVPLPQASVGAREVQERHHPSLIIAFSRFTADAWTSFSLEQCDIIRAKSDKPITSNMTSGLGMHWYQHNRVLDRVGHSMYKDVEHYPWNLMYFDRMRAEKPGRPYWLLETAPNWSGGGKQWNIHHNAAGLRAMTWMSTVLGGSMVLYWQWRSHWAGQEMLHGTCVSPTGKWRPNKTEWTRLASEFAEHGPWLLDNPPAPAEVGVVLSNEAAWAFSIDPFDEDMEYTPNWRDNYYLPLVRNHWWRDVIHESADLSGYKVLVVPLMPMLAEETRAKLAAWVAAGGKLLLGPMTGYRTEEFTAFTDQELGGLETLIGAEVSLEFSVHWQEDRVKVAFHNGQMTRTRNWCQAFQPTTGRTLARYEAGYGDGRAAIVGHHVGEGEVITLGCQIGPAAYLNMLKQLLGSAGVEPTAGGSHNVVVVPRADAAGRLTGWGLVNLATSPQSIELPGKGTDLLTGEQTGHRITLDPLQAMVIRAE